MRYSRHMIKWMKLVTCLVIVLSATGCKSFKLATTSVAYQSIRTDFTQPEKIPEEARIAVCYDISADGGITAIVFNRTDEIMVIDQTKSFFVDSDGKSLSYYDPTIKGTSTTDMSSNTTSTSLNLGVIGGALGVGGVLGNLLGGINVGNASTYGQSTTQTTYIKDQPQFSLAPHSNIAMSKVFNITGIGRNYLKDPATCTVVNLPQDQSYCRFSVCISYSLDDGKSFEKLITHFYANSRVVRPVTDSQMVNGALRSMYEAKPDALYEPWWILHFPNNAEITEAITNSGIVLASTNLQGSSINSRCQGLIYDFQ